MGLVSRFALPLICFWFAAVPLRAAILNVNEVMANAPEPEASLEWIELYVDAATTDLSFYELRIGSTILTMTGTATSGDYILICRDTTAVKARWSVPSEQKRVRYFQRTFVLANPSGTVEIGLPGIPPASSLSWTTQGNDGVSWERESIATSSIVQSRDQLKATPGFVNSTTLLDEDLALTRVTAAFSQGVVVLDLEIDNFSNQFFQTPSARVYDLDTLNPDTLGDFLWAESLTPIDSGFSALARIVLASLEGVHRPIAVVLGLDQRNRNNRFDLVAPGISFPSVILNEFLPNPTAPHFSEWIEVKNRTGGFVSLNNWQVGDIGSLTTLPTISLFLPPGGYAVLVQDSISFRSVYGSQIQNLIQPASWNSLGNSGDLIRLVDHFGYEASRFGWSGSFSGNTTRARDEDNFIDTTWGESEDVGGTPGTRNVVRLKASSDEISLVLDPPFVQPGSLQFGQASIRINPSPADSYSLRIFEIEGREVATFLDHAPTYRSTYLWDGYVRGHHAPPGQYIVLLEAHGVESIRKVIAVVPE